MTNTFRVAIRREGWADYSRGDAQRGWLEMAPSNPPSGPRLILRNGIAWVPIAGLRIIRHGLDHLRCADFKTNEDHHDSPIWAGKTGSMAHECGRAHNGFWTMFRSDHLKTTKAEAKAARANGFVDISYEDGSAIDIWSKGRP